jgi:uncharacterized protein HemX
MDIQPAKSTPIVPIVEAAGDPPADEEVKEEASQPTETADAEETPAETTDAAKPEASEKAEEKNPFAVPDMPHKKTGTPIAAIAIAILVAVGLAGVTVYAYMKTQNETKSPYETGSQQTEQPASVTPADVDSTSKEIDDAVNSIDDSKDLPENELSDQSLGL